MSVRVVFADLDGTLLSTSHTVSAFTREVLGRLRRDCPAVKFVVATGRPYPDVLESMQLLDLHPDYIISNNGAVVHEGETQRCVARHALPVDVVRRLLSVPLPVAPATAASTSAPTTPKSANHSDASALRVPVVAANLFREDDWVTTWRVEGLGASYRPSFQPRVVTNLPEQAALHEQVQQLFFYGPHEHLVPIEAELKRSFRNDISFSFSLPYILDIAPPAIDKGTAARDVLALLGVPSQNAAAFGDGMNDFPMLSSVGHGFLMANSFPQLVDVAPQLEMIGSHDEDGVAKKLLEMFAL